MNIEKNIPIPPDTNRSAWPFAEMEIGDSIKVESMREWGRTTAAAHSYGQRKKAKFHCRWQNDENIGRIWRIA